MTARQNDDGTVGNASGQQISNNVFSGSTGCGGSNCTTTTALQKVSHPLLSDTVAVEENGKEITLAILPSSLYFKLQHRHR